MANKIYLDYNATTPLESDVLDSITGALKEAWGNPSSCHDAGIAAKSLIDQARNHVADLVGATCKDIIFTSGGTESNNLVLWTAIKHYLKRDKTSKPHFITSNLEHDSVKLVLEHFEKEDIAEVTYVPASKLSGKVEVNDVISSVRENTILVTIMNANNETGIIQPISEIGERIAIMNKTKERMHKRILFHTDAAQTIGKIKVDVNDLKVDYLTIVGQKFYGPRIGALYVRDLGKEIPLYPMFYGGGQEKNYRPGTENTGMICGLGKAAELIVNNLQTYHEHMLGIRNFLEEQLQDTFQDKVQINGKMENSERIPNTCNVSFIGKGLEGNRILSMCNYTQASIGAACHSSLGTRASAILIAIGIPLDVAKNAIRLSVGRHTTRRDIEMVIDDLKQAVYKIEKE